MDDRLFKALSRVRGDGIGVREDSPTRHPFTVEDGDGGAWTMFTDGYQLVAVRGAHEDVPPYEGKLDLQSHLFPYLTTTHGGGDEHLADFAELAAWLGAPNVDKCPVCCQSGHTEADAERLLDVTRPNKGLLYGAPVNRNLPAYTFAYLRAEVLQVIVRRAEDLPKFPSPMLLFVAPGWRVLLMGMRDESGIEAAFPAQTNEMKEAV